MTPADLRGWLANCVGKQVIWDRPNSNHVQIGIDEGLNRSRLLHFPVAVALERKKILGFAIGALSKLSIRNSDVAGCNGVLLPDAVNRCTRVDASLLSHGIVISGWFSGCTFATCQGGGDIWAGHIYVNSKTTKEEGTNDPTAQARAFEVACGAPPNSVTGFSTKGLLGAGATCGLVIGTFEGGAWQWNWITLTKELTILDARVLTNADFVAL